MGCFRKFKFIKRHKIKYLPYPDVEVVKLEITESSFFVRISAEDFSDISQGFEAPSLSPIFKETDNSSWPTIGLEGSAVNGQFTLPILIILMCINLRLPVGKTQFILLNSQ